MTRLQRQRIEHIADDEDDTRVDHSQYPAALSHRIDGLR